MADEPRPALWTSEEVAAVTGGSATAAFKVGGISIDTRTLRPGDLFIALRANRDGHDFIAAAFAAGAAGVLAERADGGPAVVVRHTSDALEALARAGRERANEAMRAAVTGSVGKTTVVQAVRAGLQRAGAAHASVKSYNNHIGVPLTLARMPPATRRAVFEIGMNHAGEIAPLSRLVRPRAVAVTNVEAVHVENFADGEAGVARAKAEIFEGVPPGGVAVLNADNRWFGQLCRDAASRGLTVRSFGRALDADARLLDFATTENGARIEARLDGRRLVFDLRQSAEHCGPTSLCALLLMQALDVDIGTGIAALGEVAALPGRGLERRLCFDGKPLRLIDDSYNASPVSMRAAIADLGRRAASGRRIAALTDMLELGETARARHAELAEPLAEAGVDLVFCGGPLMRSLWDALPPRLRGAWAADADCLAPRLTEALEPGDVVLVKGSNASRAGRLVEALTRPRQEGDG